MASPRKASTAMGISDDDVPDVEIVKKPKRSEGTVVMLDMDTLREPRTATVTSKAAR